MRLLTSFSRRTLFGLAAAAGFAMAPLTGVSAAGLDITEDDIVIGDPNAEITMIEYASMSCPHCASFHNGSYKNLKEDYIDTGKVKFVYRDLPWNGAAFRAALMTRCLPADKQEAGIALVYKTQADWLKSSANATSLQEALNEVFSVTGMTPEQAEACINDKAMQEKILAGRAEALDVLKVDGTPFIFLDGKKLNRTGGYSEWRKFIDAKLD